MINKTGRIGKMFSSYGLAQIPLLIGLLIMAIAVPVATKLVEENQDTRNLATSCVAGIVNTYGCGGTVSVSAGAYGCTNSVNTKCPADKWAQLSRNTTCGCSAVCATSTACSTANPPPPTAVPTTRPTAKPAATNTPVAIQPTIGGSCGGIGESCCKSLRTGATYCSEGTCVNGKCLTNTPTPTTVVACSSTKPCPRGHLCVDNVCIVGTVTPKPAMTATPTPDSGGPIIIPPTNTPVPNKCVEACPNQNEKDLLQNCSPPDSDGTSKDSRCNQVGMVSACGGKDYCCPSIGGSWTTDMSKCNQPLACTEVLTGSKLQCCHPPDSDGTSDDSLCNRPGRIASCDGKDYCCPTLNGSWTTDMSKCSANLQCTQCANGKNRSIGDADCNGVVDVNDRSIWTTEFISDGGNRTEKNSWLSDFDCNGVVDVNDRTIWSTNFTI